MSIKLNSTGGGSVTLQEPTTAVNGLITFPAGTGTASVGGLSSNIVSDTAKATTSGTVVDFTGIPSWVNKITLLFSGVSTNGTAQPQLLLGTVSGFEVTGYVSGVGAISASPNITNGNITDTAAFPLYHAAIVAGAVISGNLTLAKLSGNTWTISGTLLSGNRIVSLGGAKTLLDTLTQIRLTTAGGIDLFDAGSMNIMYE